MYCLCPFFFFLTPRLRSPRRPRDSPSFKRIPEDWAYVDLLKFNQTFPRPPLNFKSKKFQIWPPFSIAVAFDGLWLQNGETFRKPNTSSWVTMIEFCSDLDTSPFPPLIFTRGSTVSIFGQIVDFEALQFQNKATHPWQLTQTREHRRRMYVLPKFSVVPCPHLRKKLGWLCRSP